MTENTSLTIGGKTRRNGREKGLSFKSGRSSAYSSISCPRPMEPRSGYTSCLSIGRLLARISRILLGHVCVDLQTDDGGKPSLSHGLFDTFQEVVALQFLNSDFCIASHPKRVCLYDFHSRKQQMKIGSNQLL